MKCLKNCIFIRCSQIRKDLSCKCFISKKSVNLGETCPYENKTITELNMEANFDGDLKEICEKLNKQQKTIQQSKQQIQDRINQLENDLEESINRINDNPMSETYRKEYRDEIRTLKWVLELF